MLANVQRKTIKPIIEKAIAKGTLVFTDEYDIYGNLKRMGYEHKTVCHSKGEYARDEDGDGFYEVHVNTMEGVWSLLRSWLRPHRGISQEHLPYYIGFFEFVHNTRARGKSLLKSMLQIFLSPPCNPACDVPAKNKTSLFLRRNFFHILVLNQYFALDFRWRF